MTKCIIIEDEVRCINVLQSIIKSNNWLPIDIKALLDPIVDAVQYINERKPDFVFSILSSMMALILISYNKKLCIC